MKDSETNHGSCQQGWLSHPAGGVLLPKLHELEMARVFQDTWQFVAHESEVAEPGDYVQRTLGTDHVIISRDEDGVLHALLNACKHRGSNALFGGLRKRITFPLQLPRLDLRERRPTARSAKREDLYVNNPLDRRKHSLRRLGLRRSTA